MVHIKGMHFFRLILFFFSWLGSFLYAESLPGLEDVLKKPFIEGESLENLLDKLQHVDSINWENNIHFGWLAWQKQFYELSDRQWIKALHFNLLEPLNQSLLKQLCLLYEAMHNKIQAAWAYEVYLEMYPQDPNWERIVLRLGNIYQELNIPDRAIYYYFSLIQRAIAIPPEKLEVYRKYMFFAEMGIANAYIEKKDSAKALEYLEKIKIEGVPEAIVASILYKKAVCAYQSFQYEQAMNTLEDFCNRFENNEHAPEAYYLLSKIYQIKHVKNKLMPHVLKLLQLGQQKRIEQKTYWEDWDRRQKQVAQDVSQYFYDNNEIMDALKIYQALVQLDLRAEWQWPILCKIGLCYERMGLIIKSKAAYSLLANCNESWQGQTLTITPTLQAYKTQAEWHLDQLNQYEKQKLMLEALLNHA